MKYKKARHKYTIKYRILCFLSALMLCMMMPYQGLFLLQAQATLAEEQSPDQSSSQTLTESEEGEGSTDPSQQEAQKAEAIQTNEIPRWPLGPAVSAEGAILIEAETGTVLYGKNIHEKLYPASTTKILTTLIAAERCQLSETVKFSKEAVNSIERASSNMGIDIGQELTVEQCLYGILVYSANEVANGIAEHVSGSIPEFVELMNQRATELGCTDSHFVTTNGLHDDNHYTTPYDLAQIGRAFFANETLAKISGTNYYHIAPTAHQPDDIELYTHNQMTKGKYKYEGYVGGKTGYTTVAHQTLVTCAERGGLRLICVVMREDSPNQYLDTMTLFDYGFENFQKVNVSEQEDRYTIKDLDLFENAAITGNGALTGIRQSDTIVMPNTLSFGELDAFMSQTEDPEDPSVIATIDYSYENIPLGNANIVWIDSGQSYDFYATGRTMFDDDGKVITIDVKKTVLIVVGVFLVLLLFTFLFDAVKNYHFAKRGNGQNLNFRKRERRRLTQPTWQRRQARAHKRMQQNYRQQRTGGANRRGSDGRWRR